MGEPHLFLDSSALVAGAISSAGAARALLILAEGGRILVTISEQVVAQTERALARKAPTALPSYRRMLRFSHLKIVRDPEPPDVARNAELITDRADVPILVAAIHARVDYLVTLNRRHFIDDPQVAARSGLQIGTPGDALQWLRSGFLA